MMQNTQDVWAEVLSVDWPIRGLRDRRSLDPASRFAAGGTAAAILDGSAEVVRRALPIDVRVVIELSGEGGGAWTLDRAADGPRVERASAPWSDSRLRCPADRFEQLLDPRADAMALLASGEVEVEGDIGLLLRLRSAWNEGRSTPVG